VVGGYKAESIDVSGIKVVVNAAHANTGELTSLRCAAPSFTDDMVVVYGDVLFRSYILRDLLEHDAPFTVVVDSNLQDAPLSADFACCSEPDDRAMWAQAVTLKSLCLNRHAASSRVDGRWLGMLRVKGEGRRWLEDALAALHARADFAALGLPDLLNALIQAGHALRVWYIHGHWLDVNSAKDLESARLFASGGQ